MTSVEQKIDNIVTNGVSDTELWELDGIDELLQLDKLPETKSVPQKDDNWFEWSPEKQARIERQVELNEHEENIVHHLLDTLNELRAIGRKTKTGDQLYLDTIGLHEGIAKLMRDNQTAVNSIMGMSITWTRRMAEMERVQRERMTINLGALPPKPENPIA